MDSIKFDDKGLVVVVTQDYKSKEVLMVAYMNQEAFDKTIETKIMHYYSRSRKELWKKGETSGNFQHLKSLKYDCDNDALVAMVDQVGVACHTGERSCFYRNFVEDETSVSDIEILHTIYNVILDRKANPKEGSYTNYLLNKGIDKTLKKVGEESAEVIIAAKNTDKEEVKYEVADLLYHLSVMLVQKDVKWDDIFSELHKRR